MTSVHRPSTPAEISQMSTSVTDSGIQDMDQKLAVESHQSVCTALGSRSNTHAKMTPLPSAIPTPLADVAKENKIEVRLRKHQTVLGHDLISKESGSWSDGKERILFGPYNHLYGIPGKDIRSQLIAAFNAWLKVPKESLEIITTVVGMLHTASLLYACPLPFPTTM